MPWGQSTRPLCSRGASRPKNQSGIPGLDGRWGRGQQCLAVFVFQFDAGVTAFIEGADKTFDLAWFRRRSLDVLQRDADGALDSGQRALHLDVDFVDRVPIREPRADRQRAQ